MCDACGGPVEPPPTPEANETIDRLARLPGVTPETARRLHARGFEDPADVLKLALPDDAVRKGLHRAIARNLALSELKPAPKVRKLRECPTCRTPREATADRCRACGSPWDRQPSPDELKRTLEEVAGEVYNLAADPDFQGLPSEMRKELLDTFEDLGLTTSMESEYEEQFREWRARGIDTQELERILREEGSQAFKAQFAGLVRTQILRSREGPRFLCPLCEAELPSAAAECSNCGAKFR